MRQFIRQHEGRRTDLHRPETSSGHGGLWIDNSDARDFRPTTGPEYSQLIHDQANPLAVLPGDHLILENARISAAASFSE